MSNLCLFYYCCSYSLFSRQVQMCEFTCNAHLPGFIIQDGRPPIHKQMVAHSSGSGVTCEISHLCLDFGCQKGRRGYSCKIYGVEDFY
ncbi:hypothetical protein GDO86_010575 [Hymenochirus boettgeri]|uniref:Uncharacterized protein n=1 Tax=Hymenochirus boettgeri TaxID=247094 RepID=A0A8T2JR25_9PIPI|nr:hypothetical protein GDO86_010575 [Hymenochirus boettgeri]